MIGPIDVVLVRTAYSSNLGASARAMANLGADRLILIDPKCELNSKAQQSAAGAQRHLQEHIRYSNWTEFYDREPDGLRVAMTRRSGRNREVLALEEGLRSLPTGGESLPAKRLYLIFGPEANGLASDDLAFAHIFCHLPVHGEFASYNLAQAVLLTLFVTRQVFTPTAEAVETDAPAFYFPDLAIREWLTVMGFDIHSERTNAYLTLRRLLMQKFPTEHELRVLESILQQNIRKLRQLRSDGDTHI